MKAARARNAVAVLAIALTTVLFTSLFTIAASINYSYQQENFRRAGGDADGTVKNSTWEQAEQFRQDPLIQESWCRLFVGMPHDPPFNKSHVEVSYIEPNGASHYFCAPAEGTLPREATNEAATDTHIRLHFAAYSDDVQVTLPAIREATPGEGVLEQRRADAAAADEDHLLHNFLRILLGNTQVASEELFHLSCSVAILKEKRISIL